MTKKLIIALFIAASTFSCTSDDNCCAPPITPAGDVWIVNEGNFNQGNASLVVYDKDLMVADTTVFQSRNNRGLGDIFQSLIFHGNTAYLLINNSQRIEVIDATDFLSIKTITKNIYSPRYGVVLDDKIYVSDLFKSYIYIIDTTTDEVMDSIFTGRPVEELVVHENLIFASGSDYYTAVENVAVIDPVQEKVIENIPVGKNPNAMIKDAAGMIWVMCDGVFGDDNSQALYRINASALTVDKSMQFTSFTPQFPTRLTVNASDRSKIYMNGPLGIYQIDMDDVALPAAPFINSSSSAYAIGIDPDSGHFYIGDAAAFSGNGAVSIYSPANVLLHTFKAGIGPNSFHFR
jgi:DNA-binding beta-propeller fold protein YncE